MSDIPGRLWNFAVNLKQHFQLNDEVNAILNTEGNRYLKAILSMAGLHSVEFQVLSKWVATCLCVPLTPPTVSWAYKGLGVFSISLITSSWTPTAIPAFDVVVNCSDQSTNNPGFKNGVNKRQQYCSSVGNILFLLSLVGLAERSGSESDHRGRSWSESPLSSLFTGWTIPGTCLIFPLYETRGPI